MLASAALAAVATLGCGPGGDVAPTRGVVKVEGETVTGGRVVFFPVGGGKQARAIIAEDGSFELSSFGSGDGAVAATHHILLKDVRLPGDDQTHGYRTAQAARVEVQSGEDNEFVLDVRLGRGWIPAIDR